MRKSDIIRCLAAVCFVAFFSGCETLRFAPSESQKQTAELTYQLASQVNSAGTAANSAASQQLCRGTKTNLSYIGRPAEPPDLASFASVNAAASVDAAKRPTTADLIDSVDQGLSLAAEIAILLGAGGAGIGGKKVIDWIKLAREKNQAFSEVVKGNQQFLDKLKAAGTSVASELVDEFKSQQDTQQNTSTKTLVSEIKIKGA